MLGIPLSAPGGDLSKWFIPTYVGHTSPCVMQLGVHSVHPHIRGAYCILLPYMNTTFGSSPHTWGIHSFHLAGSRLPRFIPTYVGHTYHICLFLSAITVHPHIRGAYRPQVGDSTETVGSSPHTWGIHWTAVRKMAGFSHFSYDFIRKSYFVQGLVFFGVIGAEASPTHRRGRNQCLPGAHGGSVRNL